MLPNGEAIIGKKRSNARVHYSPLHNVGRVRKKNTHSGALRSANFNLRILW
jgi:hypothetical protein